MIRLFISLYIGIMATLFLFLFVTYLIGTYLFIDTYNIMRAEQFTSEVRLLEQHSNDTSQMKIKQLLSYIGDKNKIIIEEVNANDIPKNIFLELEKKSVWCDDEDYDYFTAFTPAKYYRFKEDENNELVKKDDEIDFFIIVSLFMLVALCCFFWLYWLMKKLHYLELTADKLSKGNLSERAPIGKGLQVGRLNQRFNEMAERIEQLVNCHKQQTQAVAHEIRSPIFRLRLQLDLLKKNDVKTRQRYIQGAEDDLDQMEELVNEFLECGKMSRAELRLNKQLIALNSFTQELCLNLSLESYSSIEFNSFSDKNIELMADKLYLTRALTNLLRNAIKYGKKHVRLSIKGNVKELMFIIEDDGYGIPEEYRNDIFESYYSLSNETYKRHSGFGLGLAISQEIATLHNGQLKVDDSALGGAMFTLIIPNN